MTGYEGWVHFDGCVICPDCNEWISGEDYITAILATISAHKCKR